MNLSERDLAERRDLNNGFGDALSRAFELAATPALFSGVGYLIDRWLGTTPVFMIVFLVWAVVASIVLWWYRYDARMKKIEAELVAKRDIGISNAAVDGVEDAVEPDAAPAIDAEAAGLPSPQVIADGRLAAGVTLEDRVR